MELLRRFSFTLLLMTLTTLAACGGGEGGFSIDGSDNDDGNDGSTINLVLTIENTDVSSITPALVTATLKDNGTLLPGKVITFTSSLGRLAPLSGTVLTDINGQATIEVYPGEVEGAGTILANYDGVDSSSVGFSSAGDGDVITGKVITLTSSSLNITASNPVTLSATVTNDGSPAVGEVVTFTSTLGVLDPTSGTSLTDSDGIARIILAAGTEKGASLITATTVSGELNTIGISTEGNGSAAEGNSLAITNFTNSNSISNDSPANITIHFETNDGTNLRNEVVIFTSTLGELNPATGTALTDNAGNATIQLLAGDVRGAGVLTVSSSEGDAVTQGFFTQGDGIVQQGNKLIITNFTNSSSIANTRPASVTVHFETDNGANLSNKVISFTSTLGVLDPETGTALTNSSGNATIKLSAGDVRGAGVLTATSSEGDVVTQGFFTQGDGAVEVGNELTITSFTNSSLITNTKPAIVTIHFNADDNSNLTNEVITFTSTLGVLDPITGTVLTDNFGNATITLSAGEVRGAGVLTATSSEGDVVTQGFYTDGDGAIPIKTISLTISSPTVSATVPATLTATVLNNGVPVVGDVITFSSSLGEFLPSSGSVLTNSIGQASITLLAGETQGAAIATATSSTGESSNIGYSTLGGGVGSGVNISLRLTDVDGKTIEQISSTSPGKLVATVTGVSKAVIVNFNTDLGSIPIETAIATTGNSYVATVELLAGQSLGAGTATAELATGESTQVIFSIGASSLGIGKAVVATTGLPDGLIDVPASAISAGATAGLSVKIWDTSNATATTPAVLFTAETVEVTFISGCSGLSTPTALIDSPVTTISGVAQSTYRAQGCQGNDLITATANAGGIALSATGTVEVNSPNAGSIEFVSASPQNISLKGVGGTESATIVFRVRDTNGNVVANKNVDFSLNTEVGGIFMSPENAMTDSNGLVQTVVNSGTVPTSIRVKAELSDDTSIFTQSNLLVVSTGIPDQDSFSLSANILNPEGWDIDGTNVTITARLADAFNNPVPDGTAVSFTTEGGRIEPSCLTDGGTCSVTWNSQFPRPEGHILGDINNLNHVPEILNTMGQKYGGRVSITATAIGEESFPDLNGNGRFDTAELTAFLGNDVSGNPYDLKEAFVDHNEDGLFNPGEGGDVNNSGALEEFIDFNSDGVFTSKDSQYNGVLCAEPEHAGCSNEKSINVRGSIVLIMSGSNPYFVTEKTFDAGDASDDNENDNIIYINGESIGAATITISDLHNQPMPAETTVVFTSTVGSIVGPNTFVWPDDNHNGGQSFSVSVKGETESKSGTLLVEVTTPSGLATIYTVADIAIN